MKRYLTIPSVYIYNLQFPVVNRYVDCDDGILFRSSLKYPPMDGISCVVTVSTEHGHMIAARVFSVC